MIEIDASAVLELLLGTDDALFVSARVLRDGETLHAPHLIDLEVLQVLRRLERAGDLSASRAKQALEDLDALLFARYAHDVLAGRIWELRKNVTAYDGAYLALAEALDAPLVTRDTALSKVPRCRAEVQVV